MGSPFDTGRFADVDGLRQVASAGDAAVVVEQMLADLQSHPTEWENPTLDRFLDALTGCLEAEAAAAGERRGLTWKLFAELLVKASGYE